MIKIRKAFAEDADTVRELFRDTIVSVNRKDYDDEQIRVWSDGSKDKDAWVRKISEQNFFVAQNGAKTVGFSSITDEGYIDFMFTHKDHQKQGIASVMLEHLETVAKENHLEKVWAHVSITARCFFTRRGFEITKQFVTECNGVKFDDCIMTKYLNQTESKDT